MDIRLPPEVPPVRFVVVEGWIDRVSIGLDQRALDIDHVASGCPRTAVDRLGVMLPARADQIGVFLPVAVRPAPTPVYVMYLFGSFLLLVQEPAEDAIPIVSKPGVQTLLMPQGLQGFLVSDVGLLAIFTGWLGTGISH